MCIRDSSDRAGSAVVLCAMALCVGNRGSSSNQELLAAVCASQCAMPLLGVLAEEDTASGDAAVMCVLLLQTRQDLGAKIAAAGTASMLLTPGTGRPERSRLQARLLTQLCATAGFAGREAVAYIVSLRQDSTVRPPVCALRALSTLAKGNALGEASSVQAAVGLVLAEATQPQSSQTRAALAEALEALSLIHI
eukprot:TRINITY_DN28299_c0_g2_i1.p1 TRINITY_DN28299_c0_g2~~TRINITY_DN28299_c0_g2_i1.p1  ORF type:complete len:194 (-),score=60.06 TRINITY_DN28299_c0_g2_i1:70-651(-)